MSIGTWLFLGICVGLAVAIILFLSRVISDSYIGIDPKFGRSLTDADIEAIEFLELPVNFTSSKINNDSQIYHFTSENFYIQIQPAHKAPEYYYFNIEGYGYGRVVIPSLLKPYFQGGEAFHNANFEIIAHENMYWLYSLEGRISYIDLYKQFHLVEDNSDSFQVIAQRPATKEERNIFLFSKWLNARVLTAGVFLPFVVFGLITMKLTIIVILLIILMLMFYFIWDLAKKGEAYIRSRKVYTIEGNLSFNSLGIPYIGNRELKLHRKWKNALSSIKKGETPIKIEALMHTYDSWNDAAKLQLQPVTLISDNIKFNESDIKSTRHWGMVAYYFTVLSPLLFMVGIDRISSDLFYELRAKISSVNVQKVEDIYSSSVVNHQNISLTAIAIPVATPITFKVTEKILYSLDEGAFFFPRKKINNYREKLGLNKILLIQKEYEQIHQGKKFINSHQLTLNDPFYKRKADNFFLKLNAKNEALDKYTSFQSLKIISRNNLNLKVFNQTFQRFEEEVVYDLIMLIHQALGHLYEIGKSEGLIAKTDVGDRMSLSEVPAFLSRFPREETLEGIIFLSNDPAENHSVSRKINSTEDLIRMGVQIILWLVLLLFVIYFLILLIIRVKGNYFTSIVVGRLR